MSVRVGDLVTCNSCGGNGYVVRWMGIRNTLPEICIMCDGTGKVAIRPASIGHPIWDK